MHQYKEVATRLKGIVFTLGQAQVELTATMPDDAGRLWEAGRMIEDVRRALDGAARKPKPARVAPKPKKPLCVGDRGKLRTALWECGWFGHATDIIFSDNRKNWRRVKLWMANNIFEATQAEQLALSEAIQAQYGDRVIKVGFMKHYRFGKSLCIWLRK